MSSNGPAACDRVLDRWRAVALARHFREAEGNSIAQIADRLGRSPAPVKAYFYDPSYACKRPTASPQERQFWALAGGARTSICKRLLGSRCDGTRPALPTPRFVRQQEPEAIPAVSRSWLLGMERGIALDAQPLPVPRAFSRFMI